jgi:hypothetical protein
MNEDRITCIDNVTAVMAVLRNTNDKPGLQTTKHTTVGGERVALSQTTTKHTTVGGERVALFQTTVYVS